MFMFTVICLFYLLLSLCVHVFKLSQKTRLTEIVTEPLNFMEKNTSQR